MNGTRREHGYLDVPYTERGLAKRLGARWDPAEYSWRTATPGLAAFQCWARLPTILAEEDRGFGKGLFADPIPASSWYRNVRSAVSERDWYRVSQMVRRRAGWRCEACGLRAASPKDRALLDAHERFSYDERSGIQTLRRLICLCAACHGVTHFGHSVVTGAGQEAFSHLQLVTGMSAAQAEHHLDMAFSVSRRRSEIPWVLDLSVIASAGVAVQASRPLAALDQGPWHLRANTTWQPAQAGPGQEDAARDASRQPLSAWAQSVLELVTKPVEISKSDGGGSVTPWAS